MTERLRAVSTASVVLGLGLGLLGAALVLVMPEVGVVLAVLILVLAAVARFGGVRQLAVVFTVLTALTVPWNGIWLLGQEAGVVVMPLAIGLWILVRFREPLPPQPPTYRPLAIGMALLAVGGLVGALFEAPGQFFYRSPFSGPRDVSGWSQNMGNLVNFVVGAGMPVLLWVVARPSRRLLRLLAGSFLVGCVLSVAASPLPNRHGGGKWRGLAVYTIPFGCLCVLGIGVAVGIVLSRRRFPPWAFLAFPLLAVGVVASGSRAALGAFAVFSAVVVPFTRNRVVLGGVLVALAAGLLVLGLGIVQPEGENAFARVVGASDSVSASDIARADLTDRVLDRFWERPFTGNGFNYMRPAHNLYLGVIASAGVLGALGWGTIIVTGAWRSWRNRSDLLVAGIGAGFVAYLGAAFYDYTFWWRWLWFYIGMVYAVSATVPSADERRAPVAAPPATAPVPALAPRLASQVPVLAP